MSKGKYKRKREHRPATQHEHPKAGLPESGQEAKQAEASHATGDDKEEPPMGMGKRLQDLWEACSLTDRIIAVFTAILGVASIYQFVIVGSQLDVMKKDQRAWIAVGTQAQFILNLGAAPLAKLGITNTGKTPAKHVVAHLYVEVVPNGDKPRFEENYVHLTATSGSMSPNTTVDFSVTRRRLGSKDAKSSEAQDDPLLEFEKNDLDQGKSWIASHGIIWYDDTFGKRHWTKYCMWKGLKEGNYDASSCTRYNDTDDD